MENIIKGFGDCTPSLLLHSCCAPCSSYCLERLSNHFKITVFYYNPNIDSKEEYQKRVDEQGKLIKNMPFKNPVNLIIGDFKGEEYHREIKGTENDKEGGGRCEICFNLRLEKTASYAKEHNFDYFATTLTISPLKNADIINTIGKTLSKKYDIKYLFSDFKKKNGYKRSIELSELYGLYRQNYCGCIYSKRDNI